MKVYLDNASTTKVDERVIKKMIPYFKDNYGNASSLHEKGLSAKKAIEEARNIIAISINADSDEIYFSSGGTESNNWALKGIAFSNRHKGNHIITTKVEHKCIMESCDWLNKQGFEITHLEVNNGGLVDLEELKKKIRKDTILVSVIHGNNEIGTINDIEKIGKICKERGVYFHSDACQSFLKEKINVKEMNIDLLTLNAHKIHGPKGVGALYVRSGVILNSWQQGGGQENNMRAGTENTPGIVGFGEAVRLGLNKEEIEKMEKLRDKLIEGILQNISEVKLNGSSGKKRLCNNINLSFRYIEGESISGMLNQHGICGSTGSACSEKSLEPSYVLKAIGLNHEMANGSLRLSLSKETNEKEINYVLEILPKVVKKLREYSPYGEVK